MTAGKSGPVQPKPGPAKSGPAKPDPAKPDPASVETWLFDLDNTLYPAACNLFDQIDRRMGLFIEARLGLPPGEARSLQKTFFREHGTTLRGLMDRHAVPPADYLDFVHDIDLSVVAASPGLDAALARLPGRKAIYTNASADHAHRVLDRLEVAHHFVGIFDIADAAYLPKPDPRSYHAAIAALELDPERTVFFEDSARNLVPAHALGMTTVWVRHEAEFSARDAEHATIHHTTNDLVAWLEGVLTGPDDVPAP